ncbi:MAG: hypothetical protein ACYCRD_04860 [Leptospirillum sp.]
MSKSAARQKVLLAVGIAGFKSYLGPEYSVVGEVSQLEGIVQAIEEQEPDIIMVSRYLPGAVSLAEMLPEIRRAAPNARIVILLGKTDDEAAGIVQVASVYGVYNILEGETFGRDTLEKAVSEDRSWADIAHLLPEGFKVASPVRVVSSGTQPAAEPAAQMVPRYAKIVVVCSGKAGVGKSTVASNLLATAADSGAIGIDMDYTKPDLFYHFVPEDRSREDLRDLLNTLNLSEDTKDLTRNELSLIHSWVDALPEVRRGVTIIPGPSRDIMMPDIPRILTSELMRYAAQKSRLVIVDTGFDIADEAALDVLHTADVVLVVTTPDYAALHQTGWFRDQLNEAKVRKSKIKLVVNRAGQRGHKGAQEVAGMLEMPLAFAVPYNSADVESAYLRRKPVVLINSKLAQPFTHFVGQLIKDGTVAPKKGLFSGLLGKRLTDSKQKRKGGRRA